MNISHIFEISALFSGLLYVIGAAYEKTWCWPMGLINIMFYSLYCFESRIYGELSLQAIYLVLTLWGWYRWAKKESDKESIPRRSGWKELLWQATVILVLAAAYIFVLADMLHSKFPFIDGSLVAASIIATLMTARKQIASWFLWIPVNMGYILMFYKQQSSAMMLLYATYLFMSIIGWWQWKKKLRV